MTKSARGTVDHPGHRVTPKRSLNRRILEQGWTQLAGFIRYKARRNGIRVVNVYAGGTSQTCSLCGHRDKRSRQGKRFHCISCNHQADADHNAAINIGDRGTYIFVRRRGVTLQEIREQRLERASGQNAEQQEPVTGLDDMPTAWLPEHNEELSHGNFYIKSSHPGKLSPPSDPRHKPAAKGPEVAIGPKMGTFRLKVPSIHFPESPA